MSPAKKKTTVGKRRPIEAKEKTKIAIDHAARLYWQGESWATIARELFESGIWRRKTAQTAKDIQFEHPEEWATACERWRRRLYQTADRDATLTARNLLAYESRRLEDVEAVADSLDAEKRAALLLELARARRDDAALRQRAAHSIQANVARNRQADPIRLDVAGLIGPMGDASRKAIEEEVADLLTEDGAGEVLDLIHAKITAKRNPPK